MIAVGFGLVWLTWGTGLWGYCLIRGYDISPKQIFSPVGFYTGKWPPPPADDSQIIPSGTTTKAVAGAGQGGLGKRGPQGGQGSPGAGGKKK